VKDTSPDVALVCIDASPDQAVPLIEQLHGQFPEVAVCALSGSNDGERILRVMRAGAQEFLTLPLDTQEITSALRKFANRGDAAN